jgi:tetratricopeptide (TPR) repeat protein
MMVMARILQRCSSMHNKSCLLLFILLLLMPLPLAAQNADDIDRLIDEGIEYERDNKLELAIDKYRHILEFDPENNLVRIRLAKVLSWTNQYDEALAILDEVLAQDPEQPEALFRKAQIVSWQGRFDESINLYDSYLEQEPNHPEGLMGLARVYFWSGQNERSIEYFNRAIEAGADEVDARVNMAKVFLAMRNNEQAKVELETVLALNPEHEEAKCLLKGIPKLRKYEYIPLGVILYIYPDSSLGYNFSTSFIYHHRQQWDFIAAYELEYISRKFDHTLIFTTVYMGIPDLYLLAGGEVTPQANFSATGRVKLGINYTFQNFIGAGINFRTDFFGDAPLYSIQNETLYEIRPEISKYFGDISNITLSYSRFILSNGYDTGKFGIGITLDYYKNNAIYAGMAYGGSVEIQDESRRVFELNLGIGYRITQRLDLGFSYAYIDTQYGQTHQIGFRPVLIW